MENNGITQQYIDEYFEERGWKSLEPFQSIKVPVLAIDPDGVKCSVRFCFQLFRINPFGRAIIGGLDQSGYDWVSNYSELTHSVGFLGFPPRGETLWVPLSFQLFRINPFGRGYMPTRHSEAMKRFQLFRINPFGRGFSFSTGTGSISSGFQLFRINPFGRGRSLPPENVFRVSSFPTIPN